MALRDITVRAAERALLANRGAQDTLALLVIVLEDITPEEAMVERAAEEETEVAEVQVLLVDVAVMVVPVRAERSSSSATLWTAAWRISTLLVARGVGMVA